MKEKNREGSMVTTAITALIIFLILAIFGKSVQATELFAQKSVENPIKSSSSPSVAKTVINSLPKRGIDQPASK